MSYRLTIQLPSLIEGVLKGNAIRSYWYRDIKNFGDLLTPALLRHFGFTPVHAYPENAKLIGVGSILEHVDESFSGVVLGSGFIFEKSRLELPKAYVLSVRGALTRQRLGPRHQRALLGDPGILAPLLIGKRPPVRYDIGIVAQHVNLEPKYLPGILAKHHQHVCAISVVADPSKVVWEIAQCAHVLSASLHGIVVADALGIPSAWVTEEAIYGGRFKFDDYYSALGEQGINPVELKGDEDLSQLIAYTSARSIHAVEQLQGQAQGMFEKLRES